MHDLPATPCTEPKPFHEVLRRLGMTIGAVVWLALPAASGCGGTGGLEARIERLESRLERLEAQAYTPGLGEIMSLVQARHAKLAYAGQRANWPLALYEVGELEEATTEAARLHPHHKSVPRPLGDMLPQYLAAPIASLRSAATAKSSPAFAQAMTELTDGCNGCHDEAGFGFNIVRVPSDVPGGNQAFGPPPVH